MGLCMLPFQFDDELHVLNKYLLDTLQCPSNLKDKVVARIIAAIHKCTKFDRPI